jgi:hypothetical protein
VQRKVFRIERMLDRRMASQPVSTAANDTLANYMRSPAPAGSSDAACDSAPTLRRELSVLHNTIARKKRDSAALIGEDRERGLVDAAGKPGAAIEGKEKPTVKIPKSAEAGATAPRRWPRRSRPITRAALPTAFRIAS